MNIAFFSDTYLPDKNGVATSISQLKQELEALGHRVFIFTIKHPEADAQEMGVFRFPCMRIAREVPEARISFANPARIAGLLLLYKIDIVHTHSEFSLGLTGRFVSSLTNIPHVHTVHTMWADYRHYILNGHILSSRQIASLFRGFVRPCTAVIAPSNKALFYLKEIGIHPYHVNNGLCIENFISNCSTEKELEITQKYGIKETDFVVLFVGRISDEKRAAELYQVFKNAIKYAPSIKAVMIGRGERLKEINDAIVADGLENRIIMVGAIPYEDIANFYAISHAYCTVSISEVQPMTVIEALTMSLPIIIRADHAFDHLVEEGINGYVRHTDEDVSQALAQLANAPSMAKEMGRESQNISNKFTSKIQAKNMQELYEKVCSIGRPHFGHRTILEKE
ncbi:MAG: glycosyltransferase [Spirochaetia bacterium]